MKHYIIVKYNKNVSEQQKKELIPEITELFNNLKEISGIGDINVIPNVINRSNRYDLMIEIQMDNEEVLCRYDDSIWHKKWKEEYSSLIEKKTIFDRG